MIGCGAGHILCQHADQNGCPKIDGGVVGPRRSVEVSTAQTGFQIPDFPATQAMVSTDGTPLAASIGKIGAGRHRVVAAAAGEPLVEIRVVTQRPPVRPAESAFCKRDAARERCARAGRYTGIVAPEEALVHRQPGGLLRGAERVAIADELAVLLVELGRILRLRRAIHFKGEAEVAAEPAFLRIGQDAPAAEGHVVVAIPQPKALADGV